ncbi:MAG: hypothetical protein HZB79_03105 [Deltaproteobacteria bacterium]|nr:hypothetical protein [Deltaproteobacteria bacterium]
MAKIYIKKSKTQGKGIFAEKDIKKGETIFTAKGLIKKFTTDAKNAEESQMGPNWIGIGENVWIDIAGTPFGFINHFLQSKRRY